MVTRSCDDERMASRCTVFAIDEADFRQVPETDTLPNYNSAPSRMAVAAETPMLELGQRWRALHFAMGNQPAEHPLGFLARGGERVPALDDGERSSGRYFPVAKTVELLEAMRLLTDEELTHNLEIRSWLECDAVDGLRLFDRLRTFVTEAVRANRGIVIHVFL